MQPNTPNARLVRLIKSPYPLCYYVEKEEEEEKEDEEGFLMFQTTDADHAEAIQQQDCPFSCSVHIVSMQLHRPKYISLSHRLYTSASQSPSSAAHC